MQLACQNQSHFACLAVITIAVVLLSIGSVGDTAHAAPNLTIHEPVWDFGFVPQHAHVSHRFWVHNAGATPLTIERLDVGCSCTSASELDEPVAPGDSAAIVVTLHSGIIHGRLRKWVKLFTSSVSEEHKRVWIHAQVITSDEPTGVYRVTPRILEWPEIDTDTAGRTAPARPASTHILLANLDEEDVNVSSSVCCTPCLDSVVAPTVIHQGGSALIQVFSGGSTDTAACGAPSVTLVLNGRDATRITIPIVIE
jgi:hypothetical protein